MPKPDKSSAMSSYEEHNRRVREIISPERLLEYDITQGWEPLCRFLDVKECPEIPFPNTNSSRFCKIQTISSILIPLSILLFVLFKIFSFGFQRLTGKKGIPWLDQRWNKIRRYMNRNYKIVMISARRDAKKS